MTSETVEVARIALRLPPFWKSNVRLWIAQCDHAFTFSGISSDDTKYSALVANLDAETLSYVSDTVLSPRTIEKYHTLSQRLITQFSDSETQKIMKLLTDLQLGDEKPSHLLRKMKELSNGQLQDDFLQSLWLQRVPPHIQTVLSASSEPLDKLAIIADKVSGVVGASSTIYIIFDFIFDVKLYHKPLEKSTPCSKLVMRIVYGRDLCNAAMKYGLANEEIARKQYEREYSTERTAAVAEWYRYQTVACLATSSSPIPLKTRRVGQRCTLNLSRAETSSRWCGVGVRRGVPAQVSSTSLDHGSKLRSPSPKALV
ncbi:uncharacterized protein TNCV_3765141 [Trichonephila clavipes]|nr:uncharacterized protein TNCV_3765141 [Trichonephila clavipes]